MSHHLIILSLLVVVFSPLSPPTYPQAREQAAFAYRPARAGANGESNGGRALIKRSNSIQASPHWDLVCFVDQLSGHGSFACWE